MKIGKLIFALAFLILFADASMAAKWKAKHVVLIGLDGWGAYSVEKAEMPNVKKLMAEGSYTLKKRSVLPSSSAVNWASMYMGAGPELHGYTEWGSQTPELPSRVVNKNGIFPTVFSLLRESDPKAEIGNICEWAGIRYVCDTLALSYDKHVTDKPQNPATTKDAVEYIKHARPALLNIVYDEPDHVGHAEGHDTPAYYEKVERVRRLCRPDRTGGQGCRYMGRYDYHRHGRSWRYQERPRWQDDAGDGDSIHHRRKGNQERICSGRQYDAVRLCIDDRPYFWSEATASLDRSSDVAVFQVKQA